MIDKAVRSRNAGSDTLPHLLGGKYEKLSGGRVIY